MKSFKKDDFLKVAIVAGEASGDFLAASVINALKNFYPNAHFYGIAGQEMTAAGCEKWCDSEELSVLGISEVISQLPRLWRLRRQWLAYLEQHPPDLFIGVDATDFNLSITSRLKRKGIPTVQVKGPSVWAWRPSRVRRVKRSIDLILPLFPFETAVYKRYGMSVDAIGHPLADEIAMIYDKRVFKKQLGFKEQDPILALLPGSRAQELQYLTLPFLQTVEILIKEFPQLQIVTAMANEKRRHQFENLLKEYQKSHPNLKISILPHKARELLKAADLALLASGTVTLEAMLCCTPMVVAYKVALLSYYVGKALIKVPYMALPNLLANEKLAAEFIQDQINPAKMAEILKTFLQDSTYTAKLHEAYGEIHQSLRGAPLRAANAIRNFVEKRNDNRTQ